MEKRMAKTSTERVRAFRQRQRADKPIKIAQGPPKSGAERMRAFRARKKQMKLAFATGTIMPTADMSTCDVDPLMIEKQPKSGAERMRTFRERKRRLKSVEDNNGGPAPSTVCIKTENMLLSGFEYSYERDSDSLTELEIKPELVMLTKCHLIDRISPYGNFAAHESAHREFRRKFYDNPFGYACDICDRLWFKNELKKLLAPYYELLKAEFPGIDISNFMVCSSCMVSLNRNRVPKFSKSVGFKYPDKPQHLPPLNLVSEWLISPCIPFMQIRKMHHDNGHYGISGQIFNIPIDARTSAFPMSHDESVHSKQKPIDGSISLINKATIKSWLQYLCNCPLYRHYSIGMDNRLFDNTELDDADQQQNLLWNDQGYFRIVPGEQNLSSKSLFDKHEEELSFPSIYLGHFRKFRDDLHVSAYSIAASEIRRVDRRGVRPYHLLYLAMKVMKLRIHDSLRYACSSFEQDSSNMRGQILSGGYIYQHLETSLTFLKYIPNSIWHWIDRQQDLFAMIKQLGRPTLSLKLSANEIGWTDLLATLYRIENNGIETSEETISQLTSLQKSTLINDDTVTCVIYFNKMINVLMLLLQSKKANPFGEYRVRHYFQRVELRDRGSPYVHLLLWLENAPDDPIFINKGDTIAMIERLVSISSRESSGCISLQRHQHTYSCYDNDQKHQCGAPFMPSKKTIVITPMPKTDPDFIRYTEYHKMIKHNLERYDYSDIDSFYLANDITNDEHYMRILRAGISRPQVILKREPSEKWIIPFTPFILHTLKSPVDVQVILDDYTCAVHVSEYVNKTKNGISDLQKYLLEQMNEQEEFNITSIITKLSEDMLNSVEMTSHEAAWYLLGEPMTKTTTAIVYIPTFWPAERQKIRQTRDAIEKVRFADDATNVWRDNWFGKYEKRPNYLEEVTLAQFVADYTLQADKYVRQKCARVIRYRNYDVDDDLCEHKREMVTLHLPFRNEEEDILRDFKFLKIYNDNKDLIRKRHQQFESNLNPEEWVKICHSSCFENDNLNDVDPLQISIQSR